MIHSVRFTCVLDTNVIYPLWIRDLLLWFAHHDLYTPKWSHHIFDEWMNVMLRKRVPEPEAIKKTEAVNEAFPDALVKNYDLVLAQTGLVGRSELNKTSLCKQIKGLRRLYGFLFSPFW